MSRSRRPRTERNPGEVNVLPVLNLMVVLVAPLLLMASFFHLAAIDVRLLGCPPAGCEGADPVMTLRVDLHPDRIDLACFPAAACAGGSWAEQNGKIDWADFNQAVIDIKAAHPESSAVHLRPAQTTRAQRLVNAMDFTRTCHPDNAAGHAELCGGASDDRTDALFPSVTLSDLMIF